MEASPFKKIREREVIDFIQDHILCRFGVPREITCNNRTQFIEMKIKTMVSSLHNSSANEQAKSTNKEVVQSLKKTLEKDKGKWPEVLWVYQTTPKSSTGETCTFFFFFTAGRL